MTTDSTRISDLFLRVRPFVGSVVDYLVDIKGLPSREEAYCLCTLAIEMRVIEEVDGNAGIAMLLPKSIFKETG